MWQKVTWQDIAVHDDNKVKGFFGPYLWLSNFHLCEVQYEGLLYPSSEHAYMAAKSTDSNIRRKFIINPPIEGYDGLTLLHGKTLSPSDARKLGQTIKLRDNWEEIKYDTMLEVVFNKFLRNKDIRQKLIETGDKYLEETCYWKDTYWGVDYKLGGKNNLGRILMKVRECIKP